MNQFRFKFFLFAMFLFVGRVVPAQNVETPVSGIESPVRVVRDSRNIPYISAASESDLYFIQGYITASDRLWQMDLLRRVARGETAEIFGAATLNEDKRWRRLGFAAVAEKNLQYLSPRIRSVLESYAAGANAYIATLNEKSMPTEFRILQYTPKKWQPTDTILIGKILADALSTTWKQDLLLASLQSLSREKLADLSNQVTSDDVVLFGRDVYSPRVALSPAFDLSAALRLANEIDLVRSSSLSRIGLYAEDLAASNNWVISGRRTSSGKPLLANDPHLRPAAPGIWYIVQLSAPGLRVAGVTFPGVPGVVIGHNSSIAWGSTNVGPDVQDLYVETFDGKGNYKTPEGWQPAAVRIENINVRRNPLKPETDVVKLEVVETRNGPIILEDGLKRYALKWTALDPRNNELEAFLLINRAGSWNQFQKALQNYGGPAQNFVYADTAGNIGWYAAGPIPIRRTGDGSMPYDGGTSDGDWIGTIPFGELPHLFNPPGGLIVTANQRTVGTNYKYPGFIRNAAPPWRARRIYDLLSSKRKIDLEDVRQIQYDVTDIPLKRFSDTIVRLSAAAPDTVSILRDWDGRMTAESTGALIANEIRNCAAAKIAEENQGIPASAIRERVLQGAIDKDKAIWLPKKFASYAALLLSCDAQTSLKFEASYGPERARWTWGRVNSSRFTHPLASIPLIGSRFATPAVALSGSSSTPNVGSNVSMRFIAVPGSWDETRLVIPLGESGDPQSPFFKDQFEAWRTGQPMPFPFTDFAIEKAAMGRMTFRPAAR